MFEQLQNSSPEQRFLAVVSSALRIASDIRRFRDKYGIRRWQICQRFGADPEKISRLSTPKRFDFQKKTQQSVFLSMALLARSRHVQQLQHKCATACTYF
jgi:hypothetical protein